MEKIVTGKIFYMGHRFTEKDFIEMSKINDKKMSFVRYLMEQLCKISTETYLTTMRTKICLSCGEELPVDMFQKTEYTFEKLMPNCRLCVKDKESRNTAVRCPTCQSYTMSTVNHEEARNSLLNHAIDLYKTMELRLDIEKGLYMESPKEKIVVGIALED